MTRRWRRWADRSPNQAWAHRRGERGTSDVGHRRPNDRDINVREFADPVGCGAAAASSHWPRGSMRSRKLSAGKTDAPRLWTR